MRGKKKEINIPNKLRQRAALWANVVLKCKHAEERLALVRVQLGQLVGLSPQSVPFFQLEDGAQVNGVVPALPLAVASLLRRVLARRPHRAQQGYLATEGVRLAPDPVAERLEDLPRCLFVPVAAGHLERRLAVNKIQAGFGDDDGVVVEPQAALGERLALTVLPLQLLFADLSVIEAPCEHGVKQHSSSPRKKHLPMLKMTTCVPVAGLLGSKVLLNEGNLTCDLILVCLLDYLLSLWTHH